MKKESIGQKFLIILNCILALLITINIQTIKGRNEIIFLLFIVLILIIGLFRGKSWARGLSAIALLITSIIFGILVYAETIFNVRNVIPYIICMIFFISYFIFLISPLYTHYARWINPVAAIPLYENIDNKNSSETESK